MLWVSNGNQGGLGIWGLRDLGMEPVSIQVCFADLRWPASTFPQHLQKCWPQRGARERRGGQSRGWGCSGRGARRGEGRPTRTTPPGGAGAGAVGGAANQSGPRQPVLHPPVLHISSRTALDGAHGAARGCSGFEESGLFLETRENFLLLGAAEVMGGFPGVRREEAR